MYSGHTQFLFAFCLTALYFADDDCKKKTLVLASFVRQRKSKRYMNFIYFDSSEGLKKVKKKKCRCYTFQQTPNLRQYWQAQQDKPDREDTFDK